MGSAGDSPSAAGGVALRATPPRQDSPRRLFHGDLPVEEDLEESFATPQGPLIVNLEDLIEASRRKRAPKRRVFEIPGRHLPPFIPPRSCTKSVGLKGLHQDLLNSPRLHCDDQTIFPPKPGRWTKNRAHLSGIPGRFERKTTKPVKRALDAELCEVEDFFCQLWEIPSAPHPRFRVSDPLSSSTLLFWIRRDLVESLSFGEEDCYPATDVIHLKPTRINLKCVAWNGRSKPRLKHLQTKARMANWGRCGGSGRGRSGQYPPWYGDYPPPYYFDPAYHQGYQPGPRPFRPHGPPNTGFHQKGKQPQQQQGRNTRPTRSGAGSIPTQGNPTQISDLAKKNSSAGSKRDAKDLSEERFVDVICYNCGIPSHHKANCPKPKSYFICKSPEHIVDLCPIRK